jgi:energy-coupling factor transport system ATP-binding protein
VLGILGPNGAGKSTLAACLAGLVAAPRRAARGAARRGRFQNPEAHFSTDGPRAELAAAGSRPTRPRRCSSTGGWPQADQHPYTLSMGQKRRLALMLVTATDRWPLVILDEPTAGLDQRGAARVEGMSAPSPAPGGRWR